MSLTSPRRLKSARHHWWPQCVSRHWVGRDGMVGRLTPDGSIKRVSPSGLGSITNAHLIRLDRDGGTHWDQDFEGEFSEADATFPGVIEWLERIRANSARRPRGERYCYTEVGATQENLGDLAVCLVSLAVRSPSNRESVASMVRYVREDANIPSWEIKNLVGSNIRHDQSDFLNGRGKGSSPYSCRRERSSSLGMGSNTTSDHRSKACRHLG